MDTPACLGGHDGGYIHIFIYPRPLARQSATVPRQASMDGVELHCVALMFHQRKSQTQTNTNRRRTSTVEHLYFSTVSLCRRCLDDFSQRLAKASLVKSTPKLSDFWSFGKCIGFWTEIENQRSRAGAWRARGGPGRVPAGSPEGPGSLRRGSGRLRARLGGYKNNF